MRRVLNLTTPRMRGPDVSAVQRALKIRVSGIYDPVTATAVAEWKRRIGYPEGEINNGLGLRGQGFLVDRRPLPEGYFERAHHRALEQLLPVLSTGLPPLGRGTAPGRRLRWPLKPFDGPHPVRATFGEPRGLVGAAPPELNGGPLAEFLAKLNPVAVAGRRVIHHGIDIKAPDGTEVYAITSGTARLGGHDNFTRFVRVGDFDYVHLSHTVREGQRVEAFRTVIGRVFPGQGHVHFSRYIGANTPVNPLRFGSFVGYRDTVPPVIERIVAFRPNGVKPSLNALNGRIALFANAWDVQSVEGLRGGVYRMSYSIETPEGERVIGPYHLFQMDHLVPEAVGNILYTVQSTRHTLEPIIWYRLTLKSPSGDGWLHTNLLSPGPYVVTVNAADVVGNETTRQFPIRVKG